MRNRIQNGKSMNVLLGADISSGDALQIGDLLGIASVDGLSGETIAFRITEVYELPKVTANVIAQGDSVNWDESAGTAGEVTNVATAAAGDVTGFGTAHEAADGTTSVINVRLAPGSGVGS